jgi:hypothetical protein
MIMMSLRPGFEKIKCKRRKGEVVFKTTLANFNLPCLRYLDLCMLSHPCSSVQSVDPLKKKAAELRQSRTNFRRGSPNLRIRNIDDATKTTVRAGGAVLRCGN